jgi:hypothetical protein
MKHLKTSLRVSIALSSVAGFLGGWALLAHAPKPAPLVTQQPVVEPAALPTLAPIPSFGRRNSSNSFQQFSVNPPSGFSRPRLRTGGS